MSEYAGYLANIQDKAKVMTTEDILSDQGVLLAKSGTELNKASYSSILKFKLLKPIEDSITLSNQLTAKLIYDRITQLMQEDRYFSAIDRVLGEKPLLQRCCLQLDKYPMLLQKLTVLSMELPDIFDQSIISAYFCYICGLNGKKDQKEVVEYFLAGLSHDIGFLHIDHYIFSKKETLTAEEWKKIQSHPIIAYEILKRIEGFPSNTARAVLEHHENLDGTGYPRSKTAHELGDLGQIISLVDNVIAIYKRKFKPLQKSLRGIMPIIQINMHAYIPEAVSLILNALKHAPPSPIPDSATGIVQTLVDHTLNEHTYVQGMMDAIVKTNRQIGFKHNEKKVYAIQTIAHNTINIANSAGLYGNNYRSFLKTSRGLDAKALYDEVEDAYIMLEELVYQLQTYQKTANVYINQQPNCTIAKEMLAAIQYFEQNKRPSPPSTLVKHWDQGKN